MTLLDSLGAVIRFAGVPNVINADTPAAHRLVAEGLTILDVAERVAVVCPAWRARYPREPRRYHRVREILHGRARPTPVEAAGIAEALRVAPWRIWPAEVWPPPGHRPGRWSWSRA